MSKFCLVHGSTQNAECWDLLIPALEKFGHRILRMNLPTDKREASGMHYAEVIVKALDHVSEEVIVVAHSASGMFLPLVASIRPVRHLVYLAAVIPQVGNSIIGQFLNTDLDMFQPDWVAMGRAGKDPSQDEALAKHFLFHDCSDEITEWAMTTRILMYAQAALTEIFPLPEFPPVASSYILCTEDRTINPEWSRRTAPARLGVEAIELPGGHCPYLSRPQHLAVILNDITQSA